MMYTWDHCRRQLIEALSRYVGYTTGAYKIHRIAEVTEALDQVPSRRKLEIIRELRGDVGSNYAAGIIDFAVGLGFLRVVGRSGPVARQSTSERRHFTGTLRGSPRRRALGRSASMSRVALTDIGRAYRAARGLALGDFGDFLLQFSVLQCDADLYGVLLDIALDGPLPIGRQLQTSFGSRVSEIRRDRSDWLLSAFPDVRLRQRLLRGESGYAVSWIKSVRGPELELKPIRSDFVRHHATPRRKWALSLGHIDEDGHLTVQGRDIAVRLRANNNRYFWIGPMRGCFERLNMDSSLVVEPLSPVWNLIRPVSDEVDQDQYDFDTVISQIASFMRRAYKYMRLIRANQVPLTAVTPYIYFLEHRAQVRLNEDDIFRAIFRQFDSEFAPMSKRHSLLGYYQIRRPK